MTAREDEERDASRRAARLEAELRVHLRERDAERAGCAQVFRDMATEVRKLRRQVELATAESVELARRLTLLTSHLGIERRERRRAVQFIDAQGLLDLYAVADEAPDVELLPAASGTPHARRDDVADAFAPTQRPNALEERKNAMTHTPGRHDGARVPEAGDSGDATRR